MNNQITFMGDEGFLEAESFIEELEEDSNNINIEMEYSDYEKGYIVSWEEKGE